MSQITVAASILGKPSDSPEVQDLLRQGGGKAPKLKKGDFDAYSEMKSVGIQLAFADEAYLTKNPNLARGEGALLLWSVKFCSADYPGYTAFDGVLPLGVQFAHGKAQMGARLGAPEWSNPNLGKERWLVDGIQYAARYVDGADRILEFTMQVPMPA